jgi:hypothetical protein
MYVSLRIGIKQSVQRDECREMKGIARDDPELRVAIESTMHIGIMDSHSVHSQIRDEVFPRQAGLLPKVLKHSLERSFVGSRAHYSIAFRSSSAQPVLGKSFVAPSATRRANCSSSHRATDRATTDSPNPCTAFRARRIRRVSRA